MPVYFGLKPFRNAEISSALEDKGISLCRAAPSQVAIVARPRFLFPAFASIVHILSALMYKFAVGDKEMVTTKRTGYPLPRLSAYLPLPYPKLAVSFRDNSQDIRSKMEVWGFYYTEIQGAGVYLHEQPTLETFKSVNSLNPIRTTYCPVGYVNLAAAEGFNIILKLYTALFATYNQLYSSFDDGSAPREREDTVMSDAPADISGKRKAEDDGSQQYLRAKIGDGLYRTGNVKKDEDPLSRFTEIVVLSLGTAFPFKDLGTATIDQGGMFLQYVHDLVREDTYGVPNFISEHLYMNLGGVQKEQEANMAKIQSCWGMLKQTTAGHYLSHMTKSLQIAIQACVGVELIFSDDVYEGAVLLGGGYVIQSRTSGVLYPLSPSGLMEDIKRSNSHHTTLTKIESLLRLADDLKGTTTNMVMLHERLQAAAVSMETRQQIISLAKHLRFPMKSFSQDASSVCRALAICRGSQLEVDDPISPKVLGSSNPVELGLSCFGYDHAPSFMIPGGTRVSLEGSMPTVPRSTKGAPAEVSRNAGAWQLEMRMVSLAEAVGDYQRMREWKAITCVNPTAARKQKFRVFTGSAKTAIWAELQVDMVSGKEDISIAQSGETSEMGAGASVADI